MTPNGLLTPRRRNPPSVQFYSDASGPPQDRSSWCFCAEKPFGPPFNSVISTEWPRFWGFVHSSSQKAHAPRTPLYACSCLSYWKQVQTLPRILSTKELVWLITFSLAIRIITTPIMGFSLCPHSLQTDANHSPCLSFFLRSLLPEP